jgi:iron complex outermembrane receptor protein
VLTAEDFKTYGWRTLADALRSVRSFFVVSDRTYSHLGVRGFQSVWRLQFRMLVLIDGYRANDDVFDDG